VTSNFGKKLLFARICDSIHKVNRMMTLFNVKLNRHARQYITWWKLKWIFSGWFGNVLKKEKKKKVSLVKQELLTLPEHLSSPSVFSGVRVTRSLALCVMFYSSLFVLFLLAIVMSVLRQFTDSDYPFGIFKLFFWLIFAIFVSEVSTTS